jgi:hypothetical protein
MQDHFLDVDLNTMGLSPKAFILKEFGDFEDGCYNKRLEIK